VTHQVALVLPLADNIICLDGQGSIAACGTPKQISNQLRTHMARNSSSNSLSLLGTRALDNSNSNRNNNSNNNNSSNELLRRSSNSSVGTDLTDLDDGAITDADADADESAVERGDVIDSTTDIAPPSKASKHGFFELIISLNLGSSVATTTLPAAQLSVDDNNNKATNDNSEMDLLLGSPESIIVSDFAMSRRKVSVLVDKESKSTGGVLAGFTLILANVSVSVSWFYNSFTLGEWMQSIQQKENAGQQQFQLSEYIFSVCICLLVVFFLRMFQAVSAL